MDDNSGVTLRPGLISIVSGCGVLVAGVVLVVAAVVISGTSGLWIVWFAGPVAGAGMATLRMRVTASREGLLVNGGFRQRFFSWNDIDGFRFDEHERRSYVLVQGDRIVPLPIANGGRGVTPRRELSHVRDVLEEARTRFS